MEDSKLTSKTMEEIAKEQARKVWDSWIADSTEENIEYEYSKEDDNDY